MLGFLEEPDMGNSEIPPEKLRALLRQRAEHLKKLIEMDSVYAEEYVRKQAASVFHTAIRLYGAECMDRLLKQIAERHDRWLAGLCSCGQPIRGGALVCEACENMYKSEIGTNMKEVQAAALALFESKTIQ